jgi:DNA-binding transcriptional LysR family regulator
VARDDVSLGDLAALVLLLEVGSLTRAAESLRISQPSLSKILGRLRTHFGDPLLVRVGLSMRPTPKAEQLLEPLRGLLAASDLLRASTRDFDAASSDREFSILVTDVGMIQTVPVLMRRLEARGPKLRLRALPLDARPLEARLEAGEADLAIGAFPQAAPTLRRQGLYADPFASVVRRGHPRLGELRGVDGFMRERHIVVVASSTGHAAHRRLERAFAAALRPEQVLVRAPSFVACAFLASRTDGVATIPLKLAEFLAEDLGLELFEPPLGLEPIGIDQFWHERMQQDRGHRWFRAEVFDLLAGRPTPD